MFTGISLVRGEEAAVYGDTNVGELLKRKASEGVRVLVMTWNEKSNDSGLIAGMMGTHDEDTYKYFKVKIQITYIAFQNIPFQAFQNFGLAFSLILPKYIKPSDVILFEELILT